MAAQFTATKGRSLRGLILCSMRANFSLPTPDSPVNSTVAEVRATRLNWWQAALKAEEAPTIASPAEASTWGSSAALGAGRA